MNTMFTVDLHTHTTASDGTLTPTELVVAAAEAGITGLGITDHDTLDGLEEAAEAARQMNIEMIPGIELSIDYPHGRFHMLGYYINWKIPGLERRLTRLKENRAIRNARMLEKLRACGVDLSMEEVLADSGGGQLGRPHMAKALERKGAVESVQQAFDLYLGENGKAYVPKDKITLEEGIRLIHESKGVAVLAHPSTLKLNEEEIETALIQFKSLGLDGMECYYSQYSLQQIDGYLAKAFKVGLLVTGGSDFHGSTKPNVQLGHVIEDNPAPDAILHALKQRRSEMYAHNQHFILHTT